MKTKYNVLRYEGGTLTPFAQGVESHGPLNAVTLAAKAAGMPGGGTFVVVPARNWTVVEHAVETPAPRSVARETDLNLFGNGYWPADDSVTEEPV